MRFVAVLNKDGGMLRTIDPNILSDSITEKLGLAGHAVRVDLVDGKDVEDALDRAARSRADVVLVGGGDGTVSAAAARLKDNRKALAILPAGTMNLFARSLGIPMGLDEALQGFAAGEIRAVDIATANGRPFVHQFSIGMHARMVQLRENMKFGSRLGKIGASARAAWGTVRNAKAMEVMLAVDGVETVVRTTGIGVTNNLFGEGHLPYADHPDGGVLGAYVTVAERRGEMVRFLFNMARGRWRENPHIDIYRGRQVVLRVEKPKRRKLPAVLDGELIDLERETEIRIHPGALKILAPGSEAPAAAA